MIRIEIFRDRPQGLLGLSLKAYINKVLERFAMEKCSLSVIPIQKGEKFNLMQCPKNELEHTNGKDFLCILCWKLDVCSNLYQARHRLCCRNAWQISK